MLQRGWTITVLKDESRTNPAFDLGGFEMNFRCV
jgi:hypothetical protein